MTLLRILVPILFHFAICGQNFATRGTWRASCNLGDVVVKHNCARTHIKCNFLVHVLYTEVNNTKLSAQEALGDFDSGDQNS